MSRAWSSRAGSTLPALVNASTSQNEQRLKVPSPPVRPSGASFGSYLYTRLFETSPRIWGGLSMASRVESMRGSEGERKNTRGIIRLDASRESLP
jgi:hypothetical protein